MTQEQVLSDLIKDLSFWDVSQNSQCRQLVVTAAQQKLRSCLLTPTNDTPIQTTWKSAVDPNTGATYYYDVVTRKTQWKKVRTEEHLEPPPRRTLSALFVLSPHFDSSPCELLFYFASSHNNSRTSTSNRREFNSERIWSSLPSWNKTSWTAFTAEKSFRESPNPRSWEPHWTPCRPYRLCASEPSLP